MPAVYVTRRVHFNAAHRLHNPAWSDADNARVFGGCNNPNWHGHNYEMEVTVRGEPHPDTGYTYDLGQLRDTLERVILSKVDHKNLNLDVDFLRGIIPSSENVALAFWRQLEPHIQGAQLYSIKLWETPRNLVEVRADSF